MLAVIPDIPALRQAAWSLAQRWPIYLAALVVRGVTVIYW